MKDATLAVVEREREGLSLLAPVRVRLEQHADWGIALQLGVKLIVLLKVADARGDGAGLVDDRRLEDAARSVAGGAHDPDPAAERLELGPLLERGTRQVRHHEAPAAAHERREVRLALV